jgi:16S rRNA (guanine(966)-N(2))-methyltransferase RsmD
MRIIAGEFKSRRLITPRDDSTTRPIPDRVKVSLFGLLRGHCEGANVFDGFAGTGAIGLEAVSRGAARCVLVEKDKEAADMLRQNIENLGASDRCELVVGDALGAGALARVPRPLTLAFLDPPYPLTREPIGWMRVKAQLEKLIGLLGEDGFAVVRTPWPFTLKPADSEPAPRPEPKRKKKAREDRWSLDREEWAKWAGKGAKEEEAERDEGLPPKPGVEEPGTPADMTIPNAIGPETHVYHSTAVHLYQKRT